ncbi:MAG: TolC family protein [Candidatus Brocadiales bacterium]|nr:TolC family protein [Candidatus Bathyanammoxibius amoris]
MVSHKTLSLLAVSILVFLFQTVYASDMTKPPRKTYGLKELEQLAVERDANVESARHLVNSAKGELGETGLSYGPDADILFIYGPRGGKVTKEEIHKEYQVWMLVEQDLVDLLKIRPGRIKEMMAGVEGAEAEFEEAQRLAIYELREQYVDILEEKTQADFYLQLKDIYQNLLAIMKIRQLEKEALLSDVLEIEGALIEAKESFLTFWNNYESSRNLLALSLGLMAEEIEIRDIRPLPPLPSEEKLTHASLKNRGEIKLFEANAKQEEARASTSAYEDIDAEIFGGYRFRKNKEGEWRSGPEVGVGFSIPLSYLGLKKSRRKRFTEAKRFWESEAKAVAEETRREIRRAYERYALENIRSLNAEKGMELKREEMRIERARIENAVSTVPADRVNLLILEAEAVEMDMEKRLAEYEKMKSYYELLFLAGVSQPEELSVYNLAGGGGRKLYPRALWVWDVKNVLGNDPQEAFFVSFCKTKGIDRVFFSVNRQMEGSLPRNTDMPDFITRLHQNNIKISALFGDSLWVYPRKRARLIKRIQSIVAYNAVHGKRARFDGIHLDIEPHTLKEWGSEKKELLKMLADTYGLAKAEIATETGLLLEVDIPTFYEKVDPSVFKKIVETVDVITVMDYERKTPEKVIGAARAEIDAVVKADKGVIVGLNAGDFPDETDLEKLMIEVGNRLSATHSFMGFAIHDFDSYRALAVK